LVSGKGFIGRSRGTGDIWKRKRGGRRRRRERERGDVRFAL
jgi:hypothetical protein